MPGREDRPVEALADFGRHVLLVHRVDRIVGDAELRELLFEDEKGVGTGRRGQFVTLEFGALHKGEERGALIDCGVSVLHEIELV